MDQRTLQVYDQQAAAMAAAQRAISHTQVHRLMLHYFHGGGPTADIGCGSGRDVVWLSAAGFAAVGFEPSAAMRVEAHAAYPDIDVAVAALPFLADVPDSAFANVLCNAVLMHLPSPMLPVALLNIARILRPGGRLVVSYRHSVALHERERDGRLFAFIDPTMLVDQFKDAGFEQLAAVESVDDTRPGIVWRAAVAEKKASGR